MDLRKALETMLDGLMPPKPALVFAYLVSVGEPQTQAGIAAALNENHNRVAEAVAWLKDEGYVETRQKPVEGKRGTPPLVVTMAPNGPRHARALLRKRAAAMDVLAVEWKVKA